MRLFPRAHGQTQRDKCARTNPNCSHQMCVHTGDKSLGRQLRQISTGFDLVRFHSSNKQKMFMKCRRLEKQIRLLHQAIISAELCQALFRGTVPVCNASDDSQHFPQVYFDAKASEIAINVHNFSSGYS